MLRHSLILSVVFLVAQLGVSIASVCAQEDRPDALAAYREGRFQQAIEICLNELGEMPRNMNSYTVLGWSLLKLNRNQDALEYGLKGLEVAPNDYRVIEIVGEAYYNLDLKLEALEYLEEYSVLAPTGDRIGKVYYLMGEIFIQYAEYHHADIALTTAVYFTSTVAQWWARLGYAREMAEEYNLALEAYTQALELNSSLNDALRGKERIERKLGP